MTSLFCEGDIVSVYSVTHGDASCNINVGDEGIVRGQWDGGSPGVYVEFSGALKQPNNYYWRNGARYMGDSQLRLVSRMAADKDQVPPSQPAEPDHLAAVSAATLDYQRLLREYHRATLSRDVAQDVLDEAEKLLRGTGRELKDAERALENAHYDAAGVPLSPFQ